MYPMVTIEGMPHRRVIITGGTAIGTLTDSIPPHSEWGRQPPPPGSGYSPPSNQGRQGPPTAPYSNYSYDPPPPFNSYPYNPYHRDYQMGPPMPHPHYPSIQILSIHITSLALLLCSLLNKLSMSGIQLILAAQER